MLLKFTKAPHLSLSAGGFSTTVSASLVKELRKATGSPLMMCKKALEQEDCNIEKATDWLRKQGLALAQKRGHRGASHGLVGILRTNQLLSLVELNCETDFVAKTAPFITAAEATLTKLHEQLNFEGKAEEAFVQEFLNTLVSFEADSPSLSLHESLGGLVSRTGENCRLGSLY